MENVPFPNLVRPEVAAMGKERVDEFVKVQKELLEKLQEMNRQWFGRLQSEVNVASEFASKLVAASVVLVAARRQILAAVRSPPTKPSTSAAGDRPLPHTAPHKLLAQVEHPAGRSRLLVAVHGLAVRSAGDAIRAPSPQLLKSYGCRAPPRSSHRAAGARHHQRLARASG